VALYTATGTFNQVLGHEVKDLGGKDKVLTVHSDAIAYEREGAGSGSGAELRHRYWITWWVLRSDGATAEDTFDTLAQKVLEVVENNRQVAAKWEELDPIGESQPGYIILEGEQYRRERILVEALILT
jgi:hypothetical protein